MEYKKEKLRRLGNYLKCNPEFKKLFLSYSFSEQKTAVKMLIALKLI